MWDTLVWQTSNVSLRASFIFTRTSLSLHSMHRFIYCWYWSCFFFDFWAGSDSSLDYPVTDITWHDNRVAISPWLYFFCICKSTCKSRKFRHQKVSTGVCAYVGSSRNLHYNASSTHTSQVADFKVAQQEWLLVCQVSSCLCPQWSIKAPLPQSSHNLYQHWGHGYSLQYSPEHWCRHSDQTSASSLV